MVELKLTAAEAEMLRDALSQYVSDLRMEIANTDAQEVRESLKAEEAFLKRVLQQLAGR